MESEAQRLIRECRNRAVDRMAQQDCPPAPPGGTGAIRRQPPPIQVAPQQCPVQQLLPMSPPRSPDPRAMEHLRNVYRLSLDPVPQVTQAPPPQPYGPGYPGMDPGLMSQIGTFDPYAPQGAEGIEPGQRTSFYDMMMTEAREQVDVSGCVDDVIGRARHKAMERIGHGKKQPLFPGPIAPGTPLPQITERPDRPIAEVIAEIEGGPTLDEILAGAPQVDEAECYAEEDLDLLDPAQFVNLTDDFAMEAALSIPDPMVDEFGLPRRRYPEGVKEKLEQARQADLREQRRRMQRQQAARQQQAAEREAQAAAAQQEELQRRAAEEARSRSVSRGRSGPSTTRSRPPTRAGPSTPMPAPTRAGPCTPRPGSSTSRAGSSTPRPGSSTPRAGPPARPAWNNADEEAKKAKAAALLAQHKKRTQYQPPKLKSRPPTKPPTKPKAPRGLDERVPERRKGPDPTRAGPGDEESSYALPMPIYDDFDDSDLQPREILPFAPYIPEQEPVDWTHSWSPTMFDDGAPNMTRGAPPVSCLPLQYPDTNWAQAPQHTQAQPHGTPQPSYEHMLYGYRTLGMSDDDWFARKLINLGLTDEQLDKLGINKDAPWEFKMPDSRSAPQKTKAQPYGRPLHSNQCGAPNMTRGAPPVGIVPPQDLGLGPFMDQMTPPHRNFYETQQPTNLEQFPRLIGKNNDEKFANMLIDLGLSDEELLKMGVNKDAPWEYKPPQLAAAPQQTQALPYGRLPHSYGEGEFQPRGPHSRHLPAMGAPNLTRGPPPVACQPQQHPGTVCRTASENLQMSPQMTRADHPHYIGWLSPATRVLSFTDNLLFGDGQGNHPTVLGWVNPVGPLLFDPADKMLFGKKKEAPKQTSGPPPQHPGAVSCIPPQQPGMFGPNPY